MASVSRYFEQGEEAFALGDELDDCPHPLDSREGSQWCAGFESAQYADLIEAESALEDQRLDNPRHSQGTH